MLTGRAAAGCDGAAGGQRFDGDRWTVGGVVGDRLPPTARRASAGRCGVCVICRRYGASSAGLSGCVQRCSGRRAGGGCILVGRQGGGAHRRLEGASGDMAPTRRGYRGCSVVWSVGARRWRIVVWRGHRAAPSDRAAAFGGDGRWAVARPCDMSAIWRLLGGGLSGGVQRCSGSSGGGGASGTNNSTTNLTAEVLCREMVNCGGKHRRKCHHQHSQGGVRCRQIHHQMPEARRSAKRSRRSESMGSRRRATTNDAKSGVSGQHWLQLCAP
jgi:hypothetical protein